MSSTMLICTVGGSPEPIVAALKRWRPLKVCFIHTEQTRAQIDTIIEMAAADGCNLDAGRYEALLLHDAQDFSGCTDTIRSLTVEVERWNSRGADFQVVVDLTGGTKCMSAAIALQAIRWRCVFSYVGGAERTKDGVGVVVSGREVVLESANPWDALGYQAVDDFVVLFDQLAFKAAARVANEAKKRVTRADRKEELNTLELLASTYEAIDRFDYKQAQTCCRRLEKARNHLRAVLGHTREARLSEALQTTTAHVELLLAEPPTRAHVAALLANAKRRYDEGRTDDAVARLYRAVEAIAQTQLKLEHDIKTTAKVPIERIPGRLREGWVTDRSEPTLKLGLQDAYALLAELNDPIGKRFEASGLADRDTSPLQARNLSILAHGFECVRNEVFEKLWKVALELSGIAEADLPAFPRLGVGA